MHVKLKSEGEPPLLQETEGYAVDNPQIFTIYQDGNNEDRISVYRLYGKCGIKFHKVMH